MAPHIGLIRKRAHSEAQEHHRVQLEHVICYHGEYYTALWDSLSGRGAIYSNDMKGGITLPPYHF